MKDKTFELAERLADEAFGSKGVIEYSSRQELTVKFYEMLKETSIELTKEHRQELIKILEKHDAIGDKLTKLYKDWRKKYGRIVG